MDKIAKFNVGELVTHIRQKYHAIVVDIDPVFQASGRYNPQASKRDFAHQNPWYRLLVDGSSLITYVEESLLERNPNQNTIDHPNIGQYLIIYHGHYQSTVSKH